MHRYMISVALAALLLLGFTNTSFAASLGVKVEEVDSAEAKKLDLEPGLGLKVIEVREGSPAEKAGIKEGMIIITMAGKDIKSEDDLVEVLEKAGSKLRITVITEDGWEEEKVIRFASEKTTTTQKKPVVKKKKPVAKKEPQTAALSDKELAEIERELTQLRKRLNGLIRRLKNLKKGRAKSEKPTRPTAKKETKPTAKKETKPTVRKKPVEPDKTEKPEKPSSQPKAGAPFLGVVLESAPQGDKGVEILRVIEGYPAAKSGLKQYDIILKINGKPVNLVEEVRGFITKAGVNGTLKMEIDRYGKIIKLDVKVGERPPETQ
ncbi:MAG: PDZ domain-containing protein [Planctomycetota bacterium]|nr:MAG: PDZ domain-containing protein [Planctomycetota bacterium]